MTDQTGSAATAESRLLPPSEPEVSQAELQRKREAEEEAVVRVVGAKTGTAYIFSLFVLCSYGTWRGLLKWGSHLSVVP